MAVNKSLMNYSLNLVSIPIIMLFCLRTSYVTNNDDKRHIILCFMLINVFLSNRVDYDGSFQQSRQATRVFFETAPLL